MNKLMRQENIVSVVIKNVFCDVLFVMVVIRKTKNSVI